MFRAAVTGFRRALGSPGLILAAWLLTVLAALPATLVLRDSLQQSFGRTLAVESMAEGFDDGWYGEYREQAEGIGRTFNPTIAGVGGVLTNLEGWVNGSLADQFPGLVALAVLFAMIWALFLGGVIERYAFDDTPRGVSGIVVSGARSWMRFVRLAFLSGVVYYQVYRVHRWLMDVLEKRLLDVTEETRAMWATLAIYVATALVLVAVRASFDYAKIAIVVEDRRSALFSAVRGIVFVVTHPLRTMGLVLSIGLITAIPLGLYIGFRPSTVTPGWSGVIYAILMGQAWLVARLALRLSLVAGQTALYQSAGATSSANRGK